MGRGFEDHQVIGEKTRRSYTFSRETGNHSGLPAFLTELSPADTAGYAIAGI